MFLKTNKILIIRFYFIINFIRSISGFISRFEIYFLLFLKYETKKLYLYLILLKQLNKLTKDVTVYNFTIKSRSLLKGNLKSLIADLLNVRLIFD